jgi:nucleoside-diphosphate-sugar epimerase
MHLVIGAGPVGTTLALALAEAGTPVRVATRSGSGPVHPLVERVAADVTDLAAAARLGEVCDVVYGCANAPYTAKAWEEVWPRLQAGGLAAARATGGTYVAADNLYVYGPRPEVITEATPHDATGAKGRFRAHLSADLLAADGHGVRTAAVRAGDFFGPHVRESQAGERVVPRLLAGKGVRVLGDPDAPHAFTYVPDLVAAMVVAGQRPEAWGRAWHAPMTTVTQRQLAQAFVPAARVAAYPRWMFSALAAVVPMLGELAELRHQVERPFLVDDTAVRSVLGVARTPLAEAAAATVAWWRAGAPATWTPATGAGSRAAAA